MGNSDLTEFVDLQYIHVARINQPAANVLLILPGCQLRREHNRTASAVHDNKPVYIMHQQRHLQC